MSSEWPEVTLENLVGAVNTGLDAIKRAPIVDADTGIKCLRIQDITQSKPYASWGNTQVREPDFEKYRLRKNEIIMARTCSPGICLLVKSDMRAVFNNGLARIRAVESRLCPEFLLYIFKSKEFADYIYGISHGTSVQLNMKVGDLTRYRLRLPPLAVQKEIASALTLLDDRITLLRETNATLEAIAQALFKSWFVDFDPVRAKQAGQQPEGMDEATAALFPNRFTDSPFGLIPEGWQTRTIGDVIETFGGATPDTKNDDFWNPPEHAWTSPKDLSGLNSPILLRTERGVSSKGLTKISSGLLPVGTLLLSSRAPIGYLAISQIPIAINQGYIAMTPGGALSPLYMYFWCSQNMEVIKGRANGSTFMEISKKAFRPIELTLPSKAVTEAFSNFAEPLFSRIAENERQAQTLATIRDTLLPRLISGQLRMPTPSALADEVV